MWNALGLGLGPVLGVVNAIPGVKAGPMKPVPPRQPAQPMRPSTVAEVDQKLSNLQPAKWAQTGAQDRAQLLDLCLSRLIEQAETLAEAACLPKGTYGQGSGEEGAAILGVVMGLKEYIMSLKANGQRKPVSCRTWKDQVIVQVAPAGMMGALLPGYQGQVWLEPGKPATQGALYRRKAAGEIGSGGVSAVLGAGNQICVVFLDILHKLLADDEVVCLKMSPVNEHLGPLVESVFQPLVEAGFVQICYGGKEIGEHLVTHPLVSSIHMTGSGETFNYIMWGTSPPPATGSPRLDKGFTAELGNVTPFIVVPGPWTDADIKFHVKGILSGLTQNAAHNCIAAEVIVTDASWPLRDKFMSELRATLASLPRRAAYYPGSDAKYDAFRSTFKEKKVEEYGVQMQGCALPPWLLVSDLTPDEAQLTKENWCGVLQEVTLQGGGDPAAFLSQAIDFANNRCFGSLAVSLWCHPTTLKQLGDQWMQTVADLRYGSVCVNSPPLLGFGLISLPWGAAPGNSVRNVESGIGFVHNTFMLDYPVKGVASAPWRPQPRPPYMLDNYALVPLLRSALPFVGHLDQPLKALPHMFVAAASAARC